MDRLLSRRVLGSGGVESKYSPPIPITAGMLAHTADQYYTGIQQATIPPPYQDQVRALGLAAWKKLNEGPAKSLI